MTRAFHSQSKRRNTIHHGFFFHPHPALQAKEEKTSFFQLIPSAAPSLQTKCAACQEEENRQNKLQLKTKEEEEPPEIQLTGMEDEKAALRLQTKTEPGGRTITGTLLENRLSVTRGNDSPLPEHTRYAMEGVFGADFGKVRTHTDQAAIQINQNLHAQGFTHGNHIYFNTGKYQPGTRPGKPLLAHELTHVIQQGAAPLPASIQRQSEDKHDLTASLLSGDRVLEQCFDGDDIVKAPARGEHVFKLQLALLQLGFELPQFGADKQYGTETANAVRKFQKAAGMSPREWDGIVGKKTIGLLDRSVRNNKTTTDTDLAKDDFTVTDQKQQQKDEACKGKPAEKTCPNPNTTLRNATTAVSGLIDKVLKQQLPPIKKKADYPAVFDKIFRRNDRPDISTAVTNVRENYIKIQKFVNTLKGNRSLVRCGTDCDGGCRGGYPAYHHFSKEKNKHILTFCPDFETHDDRILIVLHESHHAAIPGSRDKAYASTRLFEKLDHAEALLNAASFHVYAAWVEKPGSQPIGPAVKDVNLITDSSKKERVNLSLGFMDQWFSLIPFDMSAAVRGAEEARVKGAYSSNNARILMTTVFSRWFGLTRPPAVPTKKDVQKLKAVEERIKKMEAVFASPFLILETQNNSFWERGPGPALALNNALLQLDVDHMITALLQELVHATPTISAEMEPLYVLTINDMRRLRDLEP